jgi:hypothetical protein
MGCTVIVMAQPALLSVLSEMEGIDRLLNGWSEAAPPHDVEIEVMELPYALRVTLETIPANVPYIHADSVVAERIALEVPAGRGMVGLFWRSSDWDQTRNLSLGELEPLVNTPDAQFFSLTRDVTDEERRLMADWGVIDLEPMTPRFEDTAAALSAFDLVIAVDSVVAHLAGAMALPVITLLRREADWRWMADRSDTPWYPTMRLIRQQREGEWDGVISEANATIRDWPFLKNQWRA